MLKIAICDDNNYICIEIEQIILDYSIQHNIKINIEVFYDGKELINYIENEHCFDIIFLDIELKTTTGIEVGTILRKKLDDYFTKIVFISSKFGYERQLFDVQPMNFLDKPIHKEKLLKCIDLVLKLLDKEKKIFKYKVGKEYRQIAFQDILYFENKLRKVKITTVDGTDEFYGTLVNIKSNLPNIFLTTHNSYIVNYNYIKKISSDNILMINEMIIPISKRNLKDIQQFQIKFLKELRDIN
ncbi:MAG: LytTR family DNA-binding domain-containing protein [Anaerotignum propionicum]|uniref:LytR/AlgR family response regulator transcription factor n=1 Tax=Anaerotignum propionicum TaxID=28446 RepID=UPI002B206422|nr:LytTR family DNA-binding domain-containing protein [Anaerotignum propionicum]MEA5056457.1 LytTR family DNA-binding domain-containing protein [Anaerotignum propionicum]